MQTGRNLTVAAILALAVSAAMGADPIESAGKIDAVTVYRGQALVTRLIDAPAEAGLREIVVTNLPPRVLPSSLYAEAGPDVEIRGLRFRTRPLSQDVREDVRKLDEQIRDAQDAIAATQRQQQVLQQRTQYLDKLEQFTAPTANAELTRGVLNAETLKALTLFAFEQRQTLASEELKLAQTVRTQQEGLLLLQRQRNDLAQGASKTLREAVIFADFHKGGGQLRVKYLVDSANWSPSYVARAGTGAGVNRTLRDANAATQGATQNAQRNVVVQYNAAIQQMSGEDWGDVSMTLSTATPSLVAAAPRLDPLRITLAANVPARSDTMDYFKAREVLSNQRQQVELNRSNNAPAASSTPQLQQSQRGAGGGLEDFASRFLKDERAAQDSELNGIAGNLQVLELQADDSAARSDRDRTARSSDEGISVTYQLPARTSLPSRSDQQSIQIASMTMPGEFYKLAMPVLTSYVYDQATLTNQGTTVLLAGPVQSYLNEEYVGLGALPTVSIGEQFTVGFGIDSSLRASRELVEKSDTTQGGNRVLSFTYRLAIENFGAEAATVRISDRLPTSKDDQVKMTLLKTAKEPTTQRVEPESAGQAARRTGILTWALDVPKAAMGEKAATLDYQYRLEFDKQLNIAGLATK